MILLEFCPRCMDGAKEQSRAGSLRRHRVDYDAVPDPECRVCDGTGYVKASGMAMRAFWACVSVETPRVRRQADSQAR